MAPFAPKMNLANFTCRFGDKYVMLDLFAEVVLPAFEAEYRRTYADAEYFLIDVTLVRESEDELILCGRLVKNTTVGRDQVFKDGKIVPDRHAIESAPTSFFAITLSNHKLLYVRENTGAPSLSTFASTIASFLGQAYRDWINNIYDKEKERGAKVTWKSVMDEYPRPSLDITPIATEGSVTAYVEKFRVINAVEVRLLPTNHELDNSPIFGEMRDVKDKMGADNIALKTQKKGDVGLDKGSVTKFISSQAEEGNSRITISGVDLAGAKLKAENESFNVAIPVKKLLEDPVAATEHLIEKLHEQVRLKVIALKAGPKEALLKIREITARTEWS